MQKRIILFSIFTALIILGLYFTMVRNKPVNLPKNTSTESEIKLSNYNATTTYAVINMSYPESSATKYPEVNSFINKVISDFQKDFGSISQSQVKEMYGREDVQFQLYANTKIATSSKSISFIIEVYEYTGGAHGGTSVSTFTYDKSGKLLKLSDVLGDNYLVKISQLAKDYAYKNFSEYSQPAMIDPGVSPNEENFSAWYLTPSNIVFIFQQYQIGPYAMGINEFPLKKSDISDILNPTFR